MRISIHAPARGASQKTLYFSISLLFQFTPLREGLQRVFECAGSSSDFNSRPCERGFAYASISFISPTNFNSRPCERGFRCRKTGDTAGNFNSRPCERGFFFILCKCIVFHISIHAPARGASCTSSSRYLPMYFNSRPCERGFSVQLVGRFTKDPISIHAPARGASCFCFHIINVFQFQFTPLREGLLL